MDEGLHTHTMEGDMRGPPLKQIVQSILKAWSDLGRIERLLLNHFAAALCQYRMMRVRTTKLRVSNLENH